MKRQVDYNDFYEKVLNNSLVYPGELNIDETLVDISKDNDYKDFVNHLNFLALKNYNKSYSNIRFLIRDNRAIYFAYVDEVVIDGNGSYITIYAYCYNDNGTLDETNITYYWVIDKLVITLEVDNETFITSDNLKSVFNQSLTGTGNITLFRHKLELTYTSSSGGPGTTYLDWLSTSNLNVDSLQDLQTLLKVSRNDTSDSNYLGYHSYSTQEILFEHSTGVFKITDEYDSYNVTAVSDKVTTI